MSRKLAGVALALGVSACGGDSAEDRAQKKVCSARADIKQQVDELKSTSVSTASLDGVQQIRTALEGLASRYEKALAPIDCAS